MGLRPCAAENHRQELFGLCAISNAIFFYSPRTRFAKVFSYLKTEMGTSKAHKQIRHLTPTEISLCALDNPTYLYAFL